MFHSERPVLCKDVGWCIHPSTAYFKGLLLWQHLLYGLICETERATKTPYGVVLPTWGWVLLLQYAEINAKKIPHKLRCFQNDDQTKLRQLQHIDIWMVLASSTMASCFPSLGMIAKASWRRRWFAIPTVFCNSKCGSWDFPCFRCRGNEKHEKTWVCPNMRTWIN